MSLKTKLKTALAVATFFAVSTTVFAQSKEIDVIINFPEGGSVHTHSMMLADSLTQHGYKVNIVNTNNCANHVNYLKNNSDKPGVWLYADSSHNENAAIGCFPTVSAATYLTTAYYRVNAVCTATSTANSIEAVRAFVAGKKSVTVAATTSAPVKVVEALESVIGKPAKMVPYSGTSGSIRGLLGGDADFWYGGLTPRSADNKELFCFATTNQTQIKDMVPMTAIAPDYKYNTLGSYWFIQGHGLIGAERATVKQDLDTIFADAKWSEFFAKGYMVPGAKYKDITVDAILKNIENLK